MPNLEVIVCKLILHFENGYRINDCSHPGSPALMVLSCILKKICSIIEWSTFNKLNVSAILKVLSQSFCITLWLD